MATIPPDKLKRRRQQIMVRLARVDAALARWKAIAANAALPLDVRRVITPPPLTPQSLEELRAMLIADLHELEEQQERRERGRERS